VRNSADLISEFGSGSVIGHEMRAHLSATCDQIKVDQGKDALGRRDVMLEVVFIFITELTLEFSLAICLAKYI
jgi:hypothetical protein